MKTIVLTGGGTAGHVTPNIALIESLKTEGWTVKYIGSYNGIEKELIEAEGIPYYGISSGKLRRYLSVQNLKDPFKVIKGWWEAYRLLKDLKPKVVFSKGGFVTVPVVFAAKMLKIPVIIHESDITPGLANKLSSKSADKICVNFPETLKYVGGKGVLTGTPIRKELFGGNKEQALEICKLDSKKPTLLIMGGSLGSVKINYVLREALPQLLPKFNVIHICGKKNISKELLNQKGYCQFEYVSSELPDLFASADIMLSRAGANALAEIVALGLPSVLIPLSRQASRGDQILNAKSMQKRGYSEVIEEEELAKELLVETILKVYDNKEFYENTMKTSSKISGVEKVMCEIREYK